MILPVRCFSCNKIIGNRWEKYTESISNGLSISDTLNNLGIKRYCCRRMFIGHVELIDKLLLYEKNNDTDRKKNN